MLISYVNDCCKFNYLFLSSVVDHNQIVEISYEQKLVLITIFEISQIPGGSSKTQTKKVQYIEYRRTTMLMIYFMNIIKISYDMAFTPIDI